MKRIGIGDVHLSGFQSDPLDTDGLPVRLGIIIKTLDFIISDGRKREIKDYDILGDLINDKSIIYNIAQDAFKEFLVRNKDLNFVIISGNHDMSSTGEIQKSAISVFAEYPNVKCIMYEPEVIGNITYVPYSDNFMDTIQKLKKNTILISHLGLNEAMLQSGLSRVDKVSIKDLSKFKRVILGHYHKPQSLSNSTTLVDYAGSIFHKDWNDKNEQKRFLIYDDCEPFNMEYVPITGFPEYKEYTITTIDQKDEILKQAEIDKNKGNRVRIRNKTSEKIKEDVSGGVLVIESQEIDITNRGIQVTQTREEQLKKYLQIKQIPENEHQEYLNILTKFDLLRKDS